MTAKRKGSHFGCLFCFQSEERILLLCLVNRYFSKILQKFAKVEGSLASACTGGFVSFFNLSIGISNKLLDFNFDLVQ